MHLCARNGEGLYVGSVRGQSPKALWEIIKNFCVRLKNLQDLRNLHDH